MQQRLWHEDVQAAATHGKGHGRIETRTITTTTWLNGYLDWPRVGQVFRLERKRRVKGKVAVEVVYGITSLSRMDADAQRLLALTRCHWSIENGLHHVRDVTLGEDRCRVRKGNAPQVLASVRNVAVYLLNRMNTPSIAAATREIAAQPQQAIPWLNDPTSTSE